MRRLWADECLVVWQKLLRLAEPRSEGGTRLRFSEIFFETKNHAKLVEFVRNQIFRVARRARSGREGWLGTAGG